MGLAGRRCLVEAVVQTRQSIDVMLAKLTF